MYLDVVHITYLVLVAQRDMARLLKTWARCLLRTKEIPDVWD